MQNTPTPSRRDPATDTRVAIFPQPLNKEPQRTTAEPNRLDIGMRVYLQKWGVALREYPSPNYWTMIDCCWHFKDFVERLFSLEQNSIWLCGQAFASFQHGLFMSEEMLDFIILYTKKVYQKILFYNFVFGQK